MEAIVLIKQRHWPSQSGKDDEINSSKEIERKKKTLTGHQHS